MCYEGYGLREVCKWVTSRKDLEKSSKVSTHKLPSAAMPKPNWDESRFCSWKETLIDSMIYRSSGLLWVDDFYVAEWDRCDGISKEPKAGVQKRLKACKDEACFALEFEELIGVNFFRLLILKKHKHVTKTTTCNRRRFKRALRKKIWVDTVFTPGISPF